MTDNLGLGIGIGLDGYHDNTYNTLPIFLDFRIGQLFKSKRIGAIIKIGSSLKSDTFQSGIFFEPSISTEVNPVKKLRMNLSISFKFQQIKNPEITLLEINPVTGSINTIFLNESVFINNLGVNVGFLF